MQYKRSCILNPPPHVNLAAMSQPCHEMQLQSECQGVGGVGRSCWIHFSLLPVVGSVPLQPRYCCWTHSSTAVGGVGTEIRMGMATPELMLDLEWRLSVGFKLTPGPMK